ncbi:FAD-dependent monooxygenase [Rhodococcus sp. ACT016]|uniref:FAD-dependent monooxygenase n=1 Tax=Rhodococcus sp. ACT016 TaxID=3134808 RepID=UPI003D271AF4
MRHRTSGVVIVGGGPVGLVLSIMLSRNGIENTLVEKRPRTSVHPKARGISARSMEVLRRVGLEDRVRSAGLPPEHVSMYCGTTLTAPDFVRATVDPGADGREVTPAPGVICSQDVLEAILFEEASELAGGAIRFGSEVASFTEDRAGVSADLRDSSTGARSSIEADYLVGCDGSRSTVRAQCGIRMDGDTGLGHYVSVRFRAPLGALVADRVSASYFLTPPGRGGFMAIDNDTHWIYQYPYDPETEDPTVFEESRWGEIVRAAAGVDDLDVSVVDTSVWRMDAALAAAYRHRRVFLAGDAAHAVPPTGGHGMNVGIGDADNLAWKLAAVLSGHAGDGLLDTYEAERRPIARQVIDVALGNACARGGYRIDDELLLTARYRSEAVVDAAEHAGSSIDTGGYTPSGLPGHRLPHVRMTGSRSTLDLIGTGFTLLHGPTAGEQWRDRVDDAARQGLPITASVLTGQAASGETWDRLRRLCGLADTGAVLVRPDGHIAWRAEDSGSGAALAAALASLLG